MCSVHIQASVHDCMPVFTCCWQRRPALSSSPLPPIRCRAQMDWFSSEVEVMPLSGRPEPKRRFVPSKWEERK
jgi:hypothetical protein